MSSRIRWLAVMITATCFAVVALLLRPGMSGAPALPVDTVPIPALDSILDSVEKKLNHLDSAATEYPPESDIRTWTPKGVSLNVTTGSSEILVVEISQNGTDWRALTHEKGRPQSSTRITMHRKEPDVVGPVTRAPPRH